VGFLDLPDQPDEPGRLERASASGADRPTPRPRELPDPDERGRAYEAMRAHASAETAGESPDAAGESQHDQRADAAGQRGYRDEVPRFMDMWADHEKRWPERRQRATDLPTDAPTPHHRDGGLRPSPERQAETAEAIGRVREAEPGLSADAQAIEQENKDTYGGSTYGRVWRAARQIALGPQLAATPLARRPYDLRHAALSLWLNATGSLADVAARAGTSVHVLQDVYVHCIEGRDDLISQQIEDAFDPDSSTLHVSQCVTASGYTHRRYRPDPVRHMSVNNPGSPGMAYAHPSSHARPSPEDGPSDDCFRSSEGIRIGSVR
jgi:hypothetical protein